MQMSNRELLGVFAALGAVKSQKMSPKLAWKMVIIKSALEPFGNAFDTGAADIRKKYAEKDENGEVLSLVGENGEPGIRIPEIAIEAANKELDELFEQTFEVANAELKISDFPDDLEVTPEIMGLLQPLFYAGVDKKK